MTKKRNSPTADSAKSGKGGGGTLSDYVELNPRVTLAKNTSVPFVSMDIIVPGTRKVYPVQERPATGSGSKFEPRDTLFARITPCLENGKIAQYAGERPGIGSTEFFVLRARPGLSDPDFVYYFANKQEVRSAAEKSMSGASGRQRAIISSLSDFECEFPPLPTQKRIAGILSAYDDLIENCQRRISILEKMARGLYREWFVHFRFPGHEGHPRVNSPLGEIPEGWEVRRVSDSFDIVGGGTPFRKEKEFWVGGSIQWFSPSDLTSAGTMFIEDSRDHITELGLAKSSARKFAARSVMLTSRATIGAIAINTCEACTNQGFITCLPNERVPLFFLFHWLKQNVPTFQRMASGATFKEISRGVFKTIEFLQPLESLIQLFELSITPMAEQILTLQRKIQTLRHTRDLLLPRLLSGQIEVGEEE